MYLCQPGKVANLARGQLNRRNGHFPVPVRPGEFDPVIRVRPSRPASACSFSILRLNLVLTHGIPPNFRVGVHSLILTTIQQYFDEIKNELFFLKNELFFKDPEDVYPRNARPSASYTY